MVLVFTSSIASVSNGAGEGLKRASDSQELKLLMVVSHHVGVGIETGSLIWARIVLNCWAISLVPSHTNAKAPYDLLGGMLSEHVSQALKS